MHDEVTCLFQASHLINLLSAENSHYSVTVTVPPVTVYTVFE